MALRPEWSYEGSSVSSFSVPTSAPPVAILLVVALAVVAGWQGVARRGADDEVRQLRSEVAAGLRRERALEATVARQHHIVQASQAELESLRFQMEAVELQLDGVDFLSRQVRTELGLPQSEATWSDSAASGEARGGAGTPGHLGSDRVTLAQRRLSAGLADLYQLLDVARARNAHDAQDPPGKGDSSVGGTPSNWPARGTVTSDFGWRLFRGAPNFHSGIDIALDYGTSVQATADGVVLGSGWQPGYGWSILLQHGSGFCTLYAHLSAAVVKVGDRIRIADVVGVSGSSGNSTGPHLHYEIWQDGTLVDPRPYMDGTVGR
jgi:hypothetical protein